MKKIWCTVILGVLFIALCLTKCLGIEPDNKYGCSDWAQKEVSKAVSTGIADGSVLEKITGDITRQEFCTLIVNSYSILKGSHFDSYTFPFDDTDDLNVSAAYELGIVKGVTNTKFAPHEYITREQMATMMDRMAKLIGCNETVSDITAFDDYKKVSPWAFESMELMVGAGIIKGTEKNTLMPLDYTTREQAIVMVWRLYRYLGGNDVVFYEDTNIGILADLNIVNKEMLNSEKNVTQYELFSILDKMRGSYTEQTGSLKEWYRGDTLKPLDYLEDSEKALLLRLWYEGRNKLLTYKEILDYVPDKCVTNREALMYVLRMVGDTYGCTDMVTLYITNDTETSELYKMAYEKQLIESEKSKNADGLITYGELCKILHKALFAEYNSGGYVMENKVRLYDIITSKPTVSDQSTAPEPERKTVDMPVNPKINNDLSVEWEFPEDYQFIINEKYSSEFTVITKDGRCVERVFMDKYDKLDCDTVVKWIVTNERFEPEKIHCRYYLYGENTDYCFDVDISQIKVIEEGEPVIPGKYIRNKNQWPAKELTLKQGYNFEKGCYYILEDHDTEFRNPEYNTVDFEVFKADVTHNTFTAPTNRSFGTSNLGNIYIQKAEVKIKGNEIVLSVTPKSEEIFEIVER